LSRRRFCLVDGMVSGRRAGRVGARDRVGGWRLRHTVMGGGRAVLEGGRRAGTVWIGWPPHRSSRVGTARRRCAGRCPRLISLRPCRGRGLPGIGPAAAASRRVVLVVHLLGRSRAGEPLRAVRRSSRPRGTRRAPGQSPRRRCSWCAYGRPRRRSGEPHEPIRGHRPAPVGHLGGQGERAQPRDPAVRGQPGDLPVERLSPTPAGKVGLHRVQLGVADLHHRQGMRNLWVKAGWSNRWARSHPW
jgi:hypothetical protein